MKLKSNSNYYKITIQACALLAVHFVTCCNLAATVVIKTQKKCQTDAKTNYWKLKVTHKYYAQYYMYKYTHL